MTKSWREVLKVHPAAELFPMMPPDELKALGEDIRKNGLRAPVVLWSETHDSEEDLLLDGRNRLDAAELAGIEVITVREDKCGRVDINVPHRILYGREGGRSLVDGSSMSADPYEFVVSANVHRRHLTAEQKRALVAEVLKAQPGSSNRKIAEMAKVDDKTVAAVRQKLEARAEIPHVETRQDSKGRQQPARKAPAKSADESHPALSGEALIHIPTSAEEFLPPKTPKGWQGWHLVRDAWRDATEIERDHFLAWLAKQKTARPPDGLTLPVKELAKLDPIIAGLKEQGRRNPATIAIGTVASLAGDLERQRAAWMYGQERKMLTKA